jgi:lysophospholipase L1-like esterase
MNMSKKIIITAWLLAMASLATTAQEKMPATQWNGKTAAYLGDSMTEPNPSEKRWYQYLKELLNIDYYVYAVSGYQWNNIYYMAKKLYAEKNDAVDAVFIWAGTNDYNNNVPLGDFFIEDVQSINHNGSIVSRKHRTVNMSNDDFCGRVNKVLSFLKEHYPTKQIVLFTPIHRGHADWGGQYAQPAETYANGQGLYIDAYIDVLKKAGAYWSVPVIDLYSLSGLYPVSDSFVQYFSNGENDRLHPNEKGHYRIAKTIQYQLLALPSEF